MKSAAAQKTSAPIEYSMLRATEKSRAVRVALRLIRWYQKRVSPHLPESCRFTPTCSQYTYQAIERFGLKRGLWLGIKRLARCRPFGACGHDPIPKSLSDEKSTKQN